MKPFPLLSGLTLLVLCGACQRGPTDPPSTGISPLEQASTPLPAADALAIPRRFLGHWASETAACRAQLDAQLRITPETVRMGRRDGAIVSALNASPDTLELQLQWPVGQSGPAALQLSVSADGRHLAMRAGKDGEPTDWQRCAT